MAVMQVAGDKEVIKLLESFPAKLEKTAIRSALAKTADYIKWLAQAGVRRKSGRLSRALVTKKAQSHAAVGVKKGGAHWYLIEFGTAPHVIKARAKKTLKIDGDFAGKEVMHPGSAPHPFMRPAIRRGLIQGRKFLEDEINRAITALK